MKRAQTSEGNSFLDIIFVVWLVQLIILVSRTCWNGCRYGIQGGRILGLWSVDSLNIRQGGRFMCRSMRLIRWNALWARWLKRRVCGRRPMSCRSVIALRDSVNLFGLINGVVPGTDQANLFRWSAFCLHDRTPRHDVLSEHYHSLVLEGLALNEWTVWWSARCLAMRRPSRRERRGADGR